MSGGKLVTTFASIPDAPVSKFTLTITGGPKGLLVITGRGRTICGKAQVTNASFGAQSGKSMAMSVTMSKPCAAVKHKAKKGGGRSKGGGGEDGWVRGGGGALSPLRAQGPGDAVTRGCLRGALWGVAGRCCPPH